MLAGIIGLTLTLTLKLVQIRHTVLMEHPIFINPFLICPHPNSLDCLEPSDSDDQTGAFQRPRPAGAELGALLTQVPPQEPDQAQGAQEEEREEGVHAVPSTAAREPGEETFEKSVRANQKGVK